ncbi:hypothetical protein F0U59_45830 [Archangium gephyra]|nr:hypothetical protein F0U59_45830 [Archangium gephyra]
MERYRADFSRWRRDASVPSLLEDLNRLMTDPPVDAFIAMGVGYKESALKNLCNIEPRTPEFLRSYCPAPARLAQLSQGHLGKGYCQFAAAWLAKYLHAAHARSSGLRDIGHKLGNHAFVTLRDEQGTEIIVDGTWRQFVGVLGIAVPPPNTILVATRAQIGSVLKQLGAANNEDARTLVKFYGGNPLQLAN